MGFLFLYWNVNLRIVCKTRNDKILNVSKMICLCWRELIVCWIISKIYWWDMSQVHHSKFIIFFKWIFGKQGCINWSEVTLKTFITDKYVLDSKNISKWYRFLNWSLIFDQINAVSVRLLQKKKKIYIVQVDY